MKPHQYHRPGTRLMPEIAPPVFTAWQRLHTAQARATAALHLGLILSGAAALALLTCLAYMLAH